jgi:hypothetical protein
MALQMMAICQVSWGQNEIQIYCGGGGGRHIQKMYSQVKFNLDESICGEQEEAEKGWNGGH